MRLQKRYKFFISETELYHCYIELQQSAPDIAKRVGCSKRTILLRLRDYQVPIRSSKDAHNIRSYLSKFQKEIPELELRKKYVDEQLGAREIGGLYNCSDNCVRNNLRRYGIHVRSKKEAQATPACIAGREKVIVLGGTPERREHSRKLMNERYKNPIEREKVGDIMRKYHQEHPDFSAQQTATLATIRNDLAVKQKHAENSRLSWTPERRLAQAEVGRRNWRNPEIRAKLVAEHKKLWRANDFEVMKKMMLANCISPNKPETSVLNTLNELCPNEWKFTGDGQVIIDGLNPDFINTNGKKLIIEVFGDYWHRQNVKPYRVNEGRVDVYARYGYKTLIIWERETKNAEMLKQKILEFVD